MHFQAGSKYGNKNWILKISEKLEIVICNWNLGAQG